ncbi:MAG: MBOAT family protein [Clostridia bacterium]|nr:MBOAT family protein [Clostridia bacterium]
MLFSSVEFLYCFLPIVLILYYLTAFSVPLKNAVLLFASLYFYAWGERKFVYVMLGAILFNYIFGLLIGHAKKHSRPRLATAWLVCGVVCNLSLLFVFKYLTFTLTNVQSLLSLNFAVPQIVLPIGISFFTFQSMSYVMDVYLDKASVQKNPFYLALYVALFPQLIAGPIVRYETVAEQIRFRKETWQAFHTGFCRFLAGLFKKVMISNQMGLVADKAFGLNASGELHPAMAWLGAIAYAFQIYYDFSGYSDMAIGLGKMFGFTFEENFNYPYISTSVTEFWRRWHISLGTWFRDYVYIPLGGSRVKTKLRLVFNLAVVWILTGVWHGAQWNFLFWGVWFFVLLTLEKLLFTKQLKQADTLPFYKKIPGWLYAMFAVLLGWVLFRAENMSLAADYMSIMFGIGVPEGGDTTALLFIGQKAIYFIAAIVFSAPIVPFIKTKLEQLRESRRGAVIAAVADIIYPVLMCVMFLVCTSYLLMSSYNPFIYFQF